MDYQMMFNYALMAALAMGGWIFRTMWGSIDALKKQNATIAQNNTDLQLLIVGSYAEKRDLETAMQRILDKMGKIDTIEVMLASHYVRKDEFARSIDNFADKLDKVVDRLDQKADKK